MRAPVARRRRPLQPITVTAIFSGFESIRELERAGAAYLIADLKLALTLLDTAELLMGEKRAKSYENARSAYLAATKYRLQLKFSALERATINRLMSLIKARLEVLYA